MSRPDFDRMWNEMLRNGVAARVAARTIAELRDHYADIEAEALAAGDSPEAAQDHASQRLGSPRILVAAMAGREELRSWIYRYPRVARIVLPLGCVMLLPVAPLFAGVAHQATVLRWLAALLLSGLVTATLMLVLQLTIAPH